MKSRFYTLMFLTLFITVNKEMYSTRKRDVPWVTY